MPAIVNNVNFSYDDADVGMFTVTSVVQESYK